MEALTVNSFGNCFLRGRLKNQAGDGLNKELLADIIVLFIRACEAQAMGFQQIRGQLAPEIVELLHWAAEDGEGD